MRSSLQGNARETTLLCVIICLHVATLLVFLRATQRNSPPADSSSEWQTAWISRVPATSTPPRAATATPTTMKLPVVAEDEPPDAAPAPASESPEQRQPPIDWHQEAISVARLGGLTGPGPGPSPPAAMREPCKPRPSSFEWKPEEKRAGFSGLMPYVVVGDRCVISLGFIGCTLGELPPANGRLFDDMKAPGYRRQESAVPDPNYCD